MAGFPPLVVAFDSRDANASTGDKRRVSRGLLLKIVALLCGLLASAFAWGASFYIADVGVEFLELWPETISQQFLGLVTWHGIVAAALVGGILAVLSPISGAILLLAVAAGWAWLAYTLPVGFTLQMIVPIALSGLGALAALGAMLRGRARRREAERQPSTEDLEREEALRFEPTEGVTPLFSDQHEPDEPVTSLVPERERPTRPDEAPPHGISGAMAVNVAALILLAGAVGLLIYSEIRSGDLMAAFSPSGPQAARVAAGEPSAIEPETDGEAPTEAAAGGPATVAADEPVADTGDDPTPSTEDASIADEGSDTEERAASLADPMRLDAMAPDDGPWQDPFSYCSAVGTMDFPDHRYVGPHVVTAVADALRVPESSSPDRVKWRCYEGVVMACAAFDRPVCALTPTVAEMVEFCAQNPGSQNLVAPNGSWSCDGEQPVIPEGQNWPVDPRGFLPGAWQTVARPDA